MASGAGLAASPAALVDRSHLKAVVLENDHTVVDTGLATLETDSSQGYLRRVRQASIASVEFRTLGLYSRSQPRTNTVPLEEKGRTCRADQSVSEMGWDRTMLTPVHSHQHYQVEADHGYLRTCLTSRSGCLGTWTRASDAAGAVFGHLSSVVGLGRKLG